MSRAATFRQVDVTRAAKGAVAAGLNVAKIEVEPGGKIVILTSTLCVDSVGKNEWDEVLNEA